MNIDRMDHAEIIALSNAEVERIIDFACAERGVKLVIGPAPMPPEKILVDRDAVIFEIKGIKTSDRALAESIRDTLQQNFSKLCEDGYDYSGAGYEFKYMKAPTETPDRIQVEATPVFSPARFKELNAELTRYKRASDEYEKAKTAYDEAVKGRNGIGENIRAVVEGHHRVERRFEALKTNLDSYVSLSPDDKGQAFLFFQKAFEKDLTSYLSSRLKDYLGLLGEGVVIGEPNIDD